MRKVQSGRNKSLWKDVEGSGWRETRYTYAPLVAPGIILGVAFTATPHSANSQCLHHQDQGEGQLKAQGRRALRTILGRAFKHARPGITDILVP